MSSLKQKDRLAYWLAVTPIIIFLLGVFALFLLDWIPASNRGYSIGFFRALSRDALPWISLFLLPVLACAAYFFFQTQASQGKHRFLSWEKTLLGFAAIIVLWGYLLSFSSEAVYFADTTRDNFLSMWYFPLVIPGTLIVFMFSTVVYLMVARKNKKHIL